MNFNNLSDTTLAGIFAGAVLIGILVVWFLNRPLKPKAAHHSGEHAHPFTIFGHAPLFYVALVIVFAATWFFGPMLLPAFNVWILELISIAILYLAWPTVYGKVQEVWAGIRGEHYHAHVPHGDDEADTIGIFFFWIAATYFISVTWAMLGHCNSDTSCSVFNIFWLRLAEVSGRWFSCPANWIFIILLSVQSRLWKSRFWGFVTFGLWVFFVMTYIYGGYNTDPWDEVWRMSGENPPALLQFLFPVTFG